MTSKEKEKMFKEVLKELKNISLFRGIYKPEYFSESYMYGIMTVMETIAKRISTDEYNKFRNEFFDNMSESEYFYNSQ